MAYIHNPISGAAGVAIGSAIVVSIGAAILENNVHDNTVTVLAGGAITGAIAGTLAMITNCCNGEDSSHGLKVAIAGIHTALIIAAKLTSPLMGEELLHYGTTWGEVVVDGLVGTGVMAAVGAGVACLAVGCACVTGISFFGRDLAGMARAALSSSSDTSPAPGV